MAQSLRRSVFGGPRLLPAFSLPHQPRHFSSTPRHAASWADTQRAMKQQATQMPTDLGLLPKTFITPSFRAQLKLITTPRSLLRFQWARAVSYFKNTASLLALKWTSPAMGSTWRLFLKRELKIRRKEIVPTALNLYSQMYYAFAEGRTGALRTVCCEGMYETFAARIGNRARGEKVEWKLVKIIGKPKIVSDRAATIPLGEGSFIRQAVVRISSQQQSRRTTKDGQVVPGSEDVKNVVEWVVVQAIYKDYVEQGWKIWGTTRESTLEDVLRWNEEDS